MKRDRYTLSLKGSWFISCWMGKLTELTSVTFIIRVCYKSNWNSRLTWCIGWSFQVTVWTAIHWTLHKTGWFVHVLGREENRWKHVYVKMYKIIIRCWNTGQPNQICVYRWGQTQLISVCEWVNEWVSVCMCKQNLQSTARLVWQ